MHLLKSWLPLGIVTTILCALVYTAIQQDMRHSANDIPVRLAEDAALALEQGASPITVVPPAKTDIALSLAPFVIAFDDKGVMLASSALLKSQSPVLPAGIFQEVRAHGEDRITWQPQPAVRIASVITRVGGVHPGFVLAGQSLRETEKRESQLTLQVVLAWLGAMVLSFLAMGFLQRR